MLCKRCKAKVSTRRQVTIICKTCGREEQVPLYNNNRCKECNVKMGICEECDRKIDEEIEDSNR